MCQRVYFPLPSRWRVHFTIIHHQGSLMLIVHICGMLPYVGHRAENLVRTSHNPVAPTQDARNSIKGADSTCVIMLVLILLLPCISRATIRE